MITRSKSKKSSTTSRMNSIMRTMQARSGQQDNELNREQVIGASKKRRGRNGHCIQSSKRKRTVDGMLSRKADEESKEETTDELKSSNYADELPFEVTETNPLADAKLVGKYILLYWPVGSSPVWYGCRVLHFDETSEKHTVMYGYGDEEWSIEYVKLNERDWKLVKVDPCAGMWARIDSLESKIGRIVYIRPSADTQQQALAKKALILGIVGQFRGSVRHACRFSTSGQDSPKYLIMWIQDGLFADGLDESPNNEQGNANEVSDGSADFVIKPKGYGDILC